jgi:NAD(P)-dependent dehydrogenase (short-subunit alcohol dehydrogenase family)
MDTPANRASLPAEMLAHAVAPEAIAGLIAFLISDAAAPVSGAILPALRELIRDVTGRARITQIRR